MSRDGSSEEKLSDLLVNLVLSWEYGSQYTHEEMRAFLSIDSNSLEYYMIISKANRTLESLGKKLVSVYDYGYKVLEPNDYNPHSIRVFSSGYKRIRRANKIIKHAPTELMSDDAREDHRSISGRLNRYVSIISKQKVELKKITRERNILDRSSERVSMTSSMTYTNII